MKQKEQNSTYDFVFIGLGASNSLILISLIQKGLTKNKKIAVFEPDGKTNNDKTYCFWANPKESIVIELSTIISRSYNAIQVNETKAENIEDCPYHYIRSIDLYNFTLDILNEAKIKIHRNSVEEITFKNKINTLHSGTKVYQSDYVFDSRPFLNLIPKNEIYLHQSFLGWHIRCVNDVFQKDTFDMMNFNIDQDKFTQFMYVIPFSDNEALVEMTRFGAEKIELSYASSTLNEYINKEFGEFEKLEEEIGCIPMTTFFNPSNQQEGILNTGARANLIKPSTGYGFKKMFAFAQLVSQRIESDNLKEFNKIALVSKERFKFYDRLLLMILLLWPSYGKEIFTRLFYKRPILTIFSFLDEKSSILEEIKIFMSLPFKPFIKALFLHLKNKNLLRYFIAVIIVAFYSILTFINYQIALYFNYLILIIGLMWIGIPHGALDHLLSNNNNTSTLNFILKYLAVIILYLALWQVASMVSLLAFVIYSSFHFGESEIIHTNKSVKTLSASLKAFLLGFNILIFIIATHLEESLTIISIINKDSSSIFYEINVSSWYLVISAASFSYILVQCIISKKKGFIGLLLLLAVGTLAPLTLAFGLYFILQHSYNAWIHLQKGLNMKASQLHKKSAVFTLGALVLFVWIAFFVRDSDNLHAFWANFFVFIACISLPHFVLMHLYYSSTKN
jgi:lycopene beta-cyclase